MDTLSKDKLPKMIFYTKLHLINFPIGAYQGMRTIGSRNRFIFINFYLDPFLNSIWNLCVVFRSISIEKYKERDSAPDVDPK